MFKFLMILGFSHIYLVSSVGPEDFGTAIMTGVGTAKEMLDRGMAVKNSGKHEIGFGPAVISSQHDTAMGFGDAMTDKDSDESISERRRRRSTAENGSSSSESLSESNEDGSGLDDNKTPSKGEGIQQNGGNSRLKRSPCFYKWYNAMSTTQAAASNGEGEVESLRSGKLRQGKQIKKKAEKIRSRREVEDEMDGEGVTDPNEDVIPKVSSNMKDHMKDFFQNFKEVWNKTIDAMQGMLDKIKTSVTTSIQEDLKDPNK